MSDLPIVKPVLGLLKSRKFIQQVLTLVFTLLVLAVPGFDVKGLVLVGVILATGLTSVYGIAKEDAAKFASEVTTPSPLTLPDQIRMIVTEIVQAYLPNSSESVDKVSVNATISTSDSSQLPTEMSSSTQ
jgi:hypothetical protein